MGRGDDGRGQWLEQCIGKEGEETCIEGWIGWLGGVGGMLRKGVFGGDKYRIIITLYKCTA